MKKMFFSQEGSTTHHLATEGDLASPAGGGVFFWCLAGPAYAGDRANRLLGKMY